MAKLGLQINRKPAPSLLISCEHAGYKVPSQFLNLMSARDRKDLSGHRGWDEGALDIARYLAKKLETKVFFTEISRLLVDCNRSAYHRNCLGAAFRVLSASEKEAILERYYWPHRQAIESEIRRRISLGQSVMHFAVHSFTPVLNGELRTADVGLLYDPRRSGEKTWAEYLRNQLAEALPELRLRRNYPYLGKADGLTTGLRQEFSGRRYRGIELEVNQAVLGSPSVMLELKKALLNSLRESF